MVFRENIKNGTSMDTTRKESRIFLYAREKKKKKPPNLIHSGSKIFF